MTCPSTPLTAGRVRLRGAVGVMLVWASLIPAHAQQGSGTGNDCGALVGLRPDAGTVTHAERVAKGRKLGGFLSEESAAGFCRASLSLKPTSASDIRAELWLPEAWNGKLLTHGGGGFSGGLGPGEAVMNATTGRGYASATSDLGHRVSATARWAHQQPEKVIDFGHRANHVLAKAAKQVIQAFYKRPAQRAYFQGCSGGGREALAEVSRYPKDYDGVIAGAPAISFSQIMTQILWNEQLWATAPRLRSKLPALSKRVLDACDALDGVRDGVLENPMQCRFDPARMQCKTFDTAGCLSGAEVSALRKFYEGPRLKNGEHLIAGPALGSEGAGWVIAGFMNSVGGPEYYRWLVHGDPAWRVSDFELDRDYARARSTASTIVNADEPNIAPFMQRGGKLILYHGWADGLISPYSTIRYHDRLRGEVGAGLDDGVRLFMVPGLQHCAEGIDLLPELEAWVEHGKAPEHAVSKAKPGATRRLCPWPQTSRYLGRGSASDASNFACS